MSRVVNIEVYCDESPDEEKEVYGVASEHRSDLPKPFDEPLQEWVISEFSELKVGESIEQAGEMEYEPSGDIIEFRRKE
jgi:hypothetical protein